MDLFVKKEKDSFKFDFDKILKDVHEDLTNKILSDLVALLDPKYMNINAEWNVRGGIYTSVSATHEK